MERHLFDGAGRVTVKDLENLDVHQWLPPTIDKAGHLVQAQPRETPRREAEVVPEKTTAEHHHEGYQQGLQAGRAEGLAEGRKSGLEQGQRDGIAQGMEQGLKRAQPQIDARLAQLDELVLNLTHALNEQDYKLEQALLNLVRNIARAVVGRELEINSRHILQVVREALGALPPSRDNIRIFVNPVDVAVLDEAKQRNGDNWRVLPDEAVTRGGCRIETEQSLVEYTVESRFTTMIEQVLARELSLPDGESEEPEQFEPAPEPLVKRRTEPLAATVADVVPAEPGLLEQVESLRSGQRGIDAAPEQAEN